MTRGREPGARSELTAAGKILLAGGAVFLFAGLAAWMWLGEWRTAATGGLVMLLTLVIVATIG